MPIQSEEVQLNFWLNVRGSSSSDKGSRLLAKENPQIRHSGFTFRSLRDSPPPPLIHSWKTLHSCSSVPTFLIPSSDQRPVEKYRTSRAKPRDRNCRRSAVEVRVKNPGQCAVGRCRSIAHAPSTRCVNTLSCVVRTQ